MSSENKNPSNTSSAPGANHPKNPYGRGPGTGLQFPPYYKPTPSVRSGMNYFPGSETLGPDEMRISFVGSCPFPPRREQAGTCIMVELGNGNRFFFDFGPGCIKNIFAMGVPCRRLTISSSPTCTWTITTTCLISSPSRRGQDGESSRCGSPGRQGAGRTLGPGAWSTA
jgi:hypothetical protein